MTEKISASANVVAYTPSAHDRTKVADLAGRVESLAKKVPDQDRLKQKKNSLDLPQERVTKQSASTGSTPLGGLVKVVKAAVGLFAVASALSLASCLPGAAADLTSTEANQVPQDTNTTESSWASTLTVALLLGVAAFSVHRFCQKPVKVPAIKAEAPETQNVDYEREVEHNGRRYNVKISAREGIKDPKELDILFDSFTELMLIKSPLKTVEGDELEFRVKDNQWTVNRVLRTEQQRTQYRDKENTYFKEIPKSIQSPKDYETIKKFEAFKTVVLDGGPISKLAQENLRVLHNLPMVPVSTNQRLATALQGLLLNKRIYLLMLSSKNKLLKKIAENKDEIQDPKLLQELQLQCETEKGTLRRRPKRNKPDTIREYEKAILYLLAEENDSKTEELYQNTTIPLNEDFKSTPEFLIVTPEKVDGINAAAVENIEVGDNNTKYALESFYDSSGVLYKRTYESTIDYKPQYFYWKIDPQKGLLPLEDEKENKTAENKFLEEAAKADELVYVKLGDIPKIFVRSIQEIEGMTEYQVPGNGNCGLYSMVVLIIQKRDENVIKKLREEIEKLDDCEEKTRALLILPDKINSKEDSNKLIDNHQFIEALAYCLRKIGVKIIAKEELIKDADGSDIDYKALMGIAANLGFNIAIYNSIATYPRERWILDSSNPTGDVHFAIKFENKHFTPLVPNEITAAASA